MKTTLIVLACIILLFLIIYAWFGGFKKVIVKISEEGGETLVYEEIKGDYRQSGQVMDKIYHSLLNEEKIETYKGFGIYYDNPQKVEKSQLRSEAGCILEEKDLKKVTSLNQKFQVKKFPTKKYMTTSFPYKGKISVMFSIIKVYPALNKYSKENGLNDNTFVMEIYDVPNKMVVYRKEIE